MTPELALKLAAMLAPHLRAMRAVTAGTRFAPSGHDNGDAEFKSGSAMSISPTTQIFIAGILGRIPA